MTDSTLLPMLCVPIKFTTTSCSKVPQGLRFPLGVSGLCTGGYFQKALIRDSDNLVKPFMQVTIQMTRYYAHFCYYLIFKLGELLFLITSICRHIDRTISSQIIFCVWHIVSEDSRIKNHLLIFEVLK